MEDWDILRKGQRKLKAESVILTRLSYCLEVTSTGRKCDMEKLQGVQSAAARWVSQTRKRDWRLKKGLKKLGWLSMCQQAAYQSIKSAMKILKDKMPERLYDSLTETRDGEVKRRLVNERKLMKMKMTTRKSWSYRSLRWLEKMPETLRKKDPTLKATKIELKKWVRDQIPVRGCRIIWGKKLGENKATKQMNDQGAGAGGASLRGGIEAGTQGEEGWTTQHEDEQNHTDDPGEEGSQREVPAGAEEQSLEQSQERRGREKLHRMLQSATIPAANTRSTNHSSLSSTIYIDQRSKEVESCKTVGKINLKPWTRVEDKRDDGSRK